MRTRTATFSLPTSFIMEWWGPVGATWADEILARRQEGSLRSHATDILNQNLCVTLGCDGRVSSGVDTIIAAYVKGQSSLRVSLLLGGSK